MEIKNYKEIPKSKSAVIATIEIVDFVIKHPALITNLYDDIYVAPDLYEYCKQNMDVTILKQFIKLTQKLEFNASKIAIQSIVEQTEILDENESCAMLYCMTNSADFITDDPRKEHVFVIHNANVINLSEIIASAAISKR